MEARCPNNINHLPRSEPGSRDRAEPQTPAQTFAQGRLRRPGLRIPGRLARGPRGLVGGGDRSPACVLQEPRPHGPRDDALSTSDPCPEGRVPCSPRKPDLRTRSCGVLAPPRLAGGPAPRPRPPRAPRPRPSRAPPLRPGPPTSADTCPKPFLGPPVPRVCSPPLPAGSSSNYKLNYELYREDIPYRAYECQKIPPLINHVPVKIRRTHMGLGVRSSFSPKAFRNSHLSPGQMKLGTGVLHSIRGELSQIKAQVDSLLASLERMDQQRDQPAGTKDSEENRGPGSEGCSCRPTEAQQEHRNQESTEPRGQCAHVEADSSQGSTDAEHAVKDHTSEPAGSQ
ncbi:uncharacterized protein LOC134387715 [Cynocephalus volans]|uniref:uncharacterized protein LOC134387715 n=1 Tax=Cynocephalus volans TaxID=110931 RepID=UPI002FC6CCA5